MIAQTFMTFFMGLAYMLWMAPSLTGWALIPLPFVGIVGWVMARGMYPYYRERQEAMAAVTSFAQENLNGIRTIQAMAQEDHEIDRFNRSSTVYAQKCYRATRYQAFMGVAMGSLSTISPLIIMFYGGMLVLAGELTVGTWTAFSFYLAMVTMSVTSIGHSLSMFVAAAAGTERLFEVLDAEPEVVDDPHFQPDAPIEGRLEFRSFSYRHPGAPRPTISNIDLHVDAGETVALLGRVGSGKSTILKAAVRLLDTPKGSVFLDDHDVCDFPVRRLREIVTLVPQDPFLFSATLRENLTYDDPERPDEPIWDAVEAAGLEPTIREMAEGLETMVGERGITLSGGQKQRATLARGLIRDAKVLLLDDCFSSVDTETEDRILSGLERLRGSKTTLLISHRVSTARHADRIYVVDNGRILETGSHEELLAKDGYYAELEAVQSNQELDRSRKSRLLHDLQADDDEPATTPGRGATHERGSHQGAAGAELLGLRCRTDTPGAQYAPVPSSLEVGEAVSRHADFERDTGDRRLGPERANAGWCRTGSSSTRSWSRTRGAVAPDYGLVEAMQWCVEVFSVQPLAAAVLFLYRHLRRADPDGGCPAVAAYQRCPEDPARPAHRPCSLRWSANRRRSTTTSRSGGS